MKKNRIVTSVLIAGLVVGGSVAAAGPANARTVTSYCQSQLYVTQPGETQGLYCQIQAGPASWGGYQGDVDGVMGPNSWKGLQVWLRDANYGYSGPIDGIPGPNTYAAMQRMAQTQGYQGAVDGVLGPNSWHYFAQAVRIQFFTD